jgi:hypothetical protein
MGDGEGVREGSPDHAARGRAGAPSPRTLCGGGEGGRGAPRQTAAPRAFLLCQALRFLEKKSVQRFQASVAAAAL